MFEYSYLGDATIECDIELMFDWRMVRAVLTVHEWIEFYEGQKTHWLSQMDHPLNLTSRVRVNPRDSLVELSYERYTEGASTIRLTADFINVPNFCVLWTDLTALLSRRERILPARPPPLSCFGAL